MRNGFLIDMDGVLYRGKQLIPGAGEFVGLLLEQDVPFLFLTNNSQRTRRDVATKLRRMGIVQEGNDVTGRYALHLHMMGEGARGTIVRGVALVDSRGKGFVPHASHGVTMIDNVAVNSWVEAFWWDRADGTADILVDGLAALGGNLIPREVWGGTPRFDLIHLMWGHRMTMRNSVAAGCASNKPTYHVVVDNQSDRPITVWLTTNRPVDQTEWMSPEEVAIAWPSEKDPAQRVVIPAGKTGSTGSMVAKFKNTDAVLRVYIGERSFDELLAMSRGNPNRIDLRLAPGRNDLTIMDRGGRIVA